jgi:hypothetical protein
MATISHPPTGAEDVPQMDYPSHQRQYRRFMHLVTWFAIHMALLLPALYFFIIAAQPLVGAILLALGIGALIYGILSIPQVTRDLAVAFEGKPDRS